MGSTQGRTGRRLSLASREIEQSWEESEEKKARRKDSRTGENRQLDDI